MKKRTAKKVIAALMCMAAAASFCSCDGKKTIKKDNIDLSKYPIKTDVELTYWCTLEGNVSAIASTYSDTEYAKGLEERTGVKIKYLHPAAGQDGEMFNLLVASGELPDIMEFDWTSAVAGGPQAAIDNDVIISLNDLMKKYAPNLTKYLKENPEVDNEVITEQGNYYVFPFIRGDQKLLTSAGFVARADWMDELSIDPPTTIDAFENMLIAFRDKKGAKMPLSFVSGSERFLYSLVGMNSEFYLKDGKVAFGPFEEEFLTGLEILNRWYKNGLLDKNYMLNDSSMLDSDILNGLTGVTACSGGSGLGKYLSAKDGEKFDLRALAVPSIKGKPNKFGIAGGSLYDGFASAAITSSCNYPELAAKYLDYLYGDEGHMYVNFGTEGKTYKMIDGYPTYTDLIMKDKSGLPVSQAMAKYIRGNMAGPFVQDVRYIEQYYERPRQKEALDVWSSQIKDSEDTRLPKTIMTAEESKEYANIYNNVKKYCDENIVSFISGEKPLSEYEDFVKGAKKLKAERALEIQQQAYDRFIRK